MSSDWRMLVLADSTLVPLRQFLPKVEVSFGPHGQVVQSLLDGGAVCWQEGAEVVLTWSRPQCMSPAFARYLEAPWRLDWEAMARETEAFAGAIRVAAGRGGSHLVTSWALPPHERGIQALSMRPGGLGHTLMRMNLLLADCLADLPNVVLLDAQRWQSACDGPVHDAKWEALGKIAMSPALLATAAGEIRAVVDGIRGKGRKLIVCDLDNTLWGGVAGDDMRSGIALGGHDARGEAFVQVQRYLKRLKERGILLAIASKNEEATALDIIDNHPEMILRREDFVAWRIDWEDKAGNIAEIVAALKLRLESVVFLDDSPAERDRVRAALPDVLVPELPEHWSGYPALVAGLSCFETPRVSREDGARTQLYRADAERRSGSAGVADLDGWLASLETELVMEPLSRESLPRAVQLLNKSNQFNMATRRLDEAAFCAWAVWPGHAVWTGRVQDKFGDQGICLVVSVKRDGGEARLVDLVMSCRVMGRGIELAALSFLAEQLREEGVNLLYASLEATAANAPIQRFLAPLFESAETQRLCGERLAVPAHIHIKELIA